MPCFIESVGRFCIRPSIHILNSRWIWLKPLWTHKTIFHQQTQCQRHECHNLLPLTCGHFLYHVQLTINNKDNLKWLLLQHIRLMYTFRFLCCSHRHWKLWKSHTYQSLITQLHRTQQPHNWQSQQRITEENPRMASTNQVSYVFTASIPTVIQVTNYPEHTNFLCYEPKSN